MGLASSRGLIPPLAPAGQLGRDLHGNVPGTH